MEGEVGDRLLEGVGDDLGVVEDLVEVGLEPLLDVAVDESLEKTKRRRVGMKERAVKKMMSLVLKCEPTTCCLRSRSSLIRLRPRTKRRIRARRRTMIWSRTSRMLVTLVGENSVEWRRK